ncbi:MAG: DsbA family protein [Cellvibrionaceae bacterium]
MYKFLLSCTIIFGLLTNSLYAEVKASGGVEKAEFSFEEGKHYSVLERPLPTHMPDVVNFFYYGCRSCYQLSPVLLDWGNKSGYAIGLVPLHNETTFADSARMFHTFIEMGELEKMHELGYVIFQTKKSKAFGAERINEFLVRHKVDKDRFWELWGSEAVNERLRVSHQLSAQIGAFKTPTFIVKKRFMMDTDTITSMDEFFALLSFLVEIEGDKS